jgi:uncharacterized membrane protein
MRTLKILFLCHILALVFGLAGLLIALPHPELWQSSSTGLAVFQFGIRYAGSLHILCGAATMLLFGLLFLGMRKTLIFFVATFVISLSMELLGTSTGLPFGPYAYTDFLGYKILAHVPFSIPLSWFYMGLTSYLLANLLVKRAGWRRRTLWSLLFGVYFLTVWDLSLDPAMASPRLPVHFWIWGTSGPYFGMPISNLLGWSLTGLIFMSVSQLLWREQVDATRLVVWLPFGMYVANTGFAIALTLDAGIWQPLLIAVVLGLLPASLVLWPTSSRPGGGKGGTLIRRISQRVVRWGSVLLSRKQVSLQVEGREHLPERGPVLLVARHFHHLYDGCVLLHTVPRPLHILIGLDWITSSRLRWLMEQACGLVQWPIVLRAKRWQGSHHTAHSAYRAGEILPYLRRATTLSVQLLRQGEVLAVFPEGYPAIDPHETPRSNETAFLPFRAGFVRWIDLAERDGHTHVTVVPAGLDYQPQPNGHWQVTLRFGSPLVHADCPDATAFLQVVEQRVHTLSMPAATEHAGVPTQRQETLPYEID